jgi:hypothetical protein
VFRQCSIGYHEECSDPNGYECDCECHYLKIDEIHLAHQRDWSLKTFGPGTRTKGVIDHIKKELNEILADPTDLSEWVDVIILAFDGAWRSGHEPAEILRAIVNKQLKNEERNWPDWRTRSEDEAIEHVRE